MTAPRRRTIALVAAWLLITGYSVFPPARIAAGPSFLLSDGWSPLPASPLPDDCIAATRSSIVAIDHLERDRFVRSPKTGGLERVARPAPLVHYKRVDRCYTGSDAALFLSSLLALTAALAALLWGGRSVVRAVRAARIGDTNACPPRSAA